MPILGIMVAVSLGKTHRRLTQKPIRYLNVVWKTNAGVCFTMTSSSFVPAMLTNLFIVLEPGLFFLQAVVSQVLQPNLLKKLSCALTFFCPITSMPFCLFLPPISIFSLVGLFLSLKQHFFLLSLDFFHHCSFPFAQTISFPFAQTIAICSLNNSTSVRS